VLTLAVIGEDVVAGLHDRVTGKAALRIVRLQRRIRTLTLYLSVTDISAASSATGTVMLARISVLFFMIAVPYRVIMADR
jgi:hypothetical protein